MYNVVIVDDEELIRHGLCKFIPWAELGFNVAAVFEDGAPVLDYIEKNTVDLILTDIKMATFSGLDIAKYVYENNKDIVICIVSGYKDFEYARTAMKYNVDYYLTKPTVIDEAIEIIKKIKEKIDSKTQSLQQQQQYSDVLEIARQQFFADIFLGNFADVEDILKKSEYVKLNHPAIYCPVWVTIENYKEYLSSKWTYGKEYFLNAICNFLNDNSNSYSQHKVLVTGSELLLITYIQDNSNEGEFRKILEENLEKAKRSIKYMLSVDINYSIGIIFHSVLELVDFLSKSIFINETSATQNIESIMEGKAYAILLEKYKNMILCIITGREKQLKHNFSGIIDLISGLKPKDAIIIIKDLFKILFTKLSDISSKNLYADFEQEIKKFNHIRDIASIISLANEILNKLLTKIESNIANTSSAVIIRQAKDYIKQNFDKDISLDDVAHYVFLNSVYFSRFFKQHTGENFIDYLINLRIKKAMELLRQGEYKIYQVSEMVGYKNSKYFARQFKKVTGLSPKEYILKLEAEGGRRKA